MKNLLKTLLALSFNILMFISTIHLDGNTQDIYSNYEINGKNVTYEVNNYYF